MSTTPRSPRMSWLVLLMSVVAILGHVCALPAHAHTSGTLAVHHDMDSAAPHDDRQPDDAVHAASCDAVKVAVPTAGVVTALVGRVTPAHDAAAIARSFIDPATFAPTPPLFLLHLALLI